VTPTYASVSSGPRVPAIRTSIGRTLLEACVSSLAESRAAIAAGADRLELCGPGEGGTTPSLALMEACIAMSTVPVHVMIRPHTHSFTVDLDWRAIMRRDLVLARRAGARGVVLGAITRDGALDTDTIAQCVHEADGLPVIFHRAFDRLSDPDRALDQLVALGVHGVLTAGGRGRAVDAAERLGAWQRRVGDAFTIMAGGGVRANAFAPLVTEARLRALHAAATDPVPFAELALALRALEASRDAASPT
jgi:copper homeostasis protein